MSKFLVMDGKEGWFNARAINVEEDAMTKLPIQLRWMVNPKIIGMPKGPFRISRLRQAPGPFSGTDAVITRKKRDLANDPNFHWEDVELVGLPVPEDWQEVGYSVELQGPVEQIVPEDLPKGTLAPFEAALRRLENGAPFSGWDSLSTVASLSSFAEENTRWRAPDHTDYVHGLLQGVLLASVRAMLEQEPDPRKHFEFVFRHDNEMGRELPIDPPLEGVSIDLETRTVSAASWGPLGTILLAAASDPFAALALGFGYSILSEGNNIAYRVSLPLYKDESGETVEIADIVWPRDVPPAPDPVVGLSAKHVAMIQLSETDGPTVYAVEVTWDRPLSPHNTPFPDAPEPVSYAIARLPFDDRNDPEAEILLTPRLKKEGGAWYPFIAAQAKDGGPLTFSDNLKDIPGLSGEDAMYAVAAQDAYGRWSHWQTVKYAGHLEPSQIPGIRHLNINPSGELEVIFSWDWTTRSPEFIELVGKFDPPQNDLGFTTRITFAGDAKPVLGDFQLVPLNQELQVLNEWGSPQQDEPASHDQAKVRYYRLTMPLPDMGVAERWFQVRARGQSHLHHKLHPFFNISGFTPWRSVEVFSSLAPDAPTFVEDSTEVPLWASVRDTVGLSRFVVNWRPMPRAAGYVLYEATETALRAALDGEPVDTAQSYATRLLTMRDLLRRHGVQRQWFRRVNPELISEAWHEVTLPRGSGVIHIFTVTSLSANGMESKWTANGDNVLAVAVPKIHVPNPPLLEALPFSEGDVLGVHLRAALGGDIKEGQVEIYRTTHPELATSVDKMGPRLTEFDVTLTDLSAAGEPPKLTDIGVDTGIQPGWNRLYYRAVCWSRPDKQKGIVEARSFASPAVSVIVPPPEGPRILDVRLNEEGSTQTEALVSWGSDAPIMITPYGSFTIVVEGLIRDQEVFPSLVQRLDTLPLLPSLDIMPLKTLGQAQLFLVGTADKYRLHAILPRPPEAPRFQLTIKMIDPLGRIEIYREDVLHLDFDQPPELSEITFGWVAPHVGIPTTLNAEWEILSPVASAFLKEYSLSGTLARVVEVQLGPILFEEEQFAERLDAIFVGTSARIRRIPGSQQFFMKIGLEATNFDLILTDPLSRTARRIVDLSFIVVPPVEGKQLNIAITELTNLGLRVQVVHEFLLLEESTAVVDSLVPPPTTHIPKGTRIEVHPRDTTIVFVSVPDVRGKSWQEAKQELEAAQLVPVNVTPGIELLEENEVESLDPAQNTLVPQGKSIKVTLGINLSPIDPFLPDVKPEL